MSKNGKTLPAGGTAERVAETAACSRAAISCDYLTTAAEGRQRKVSDLLGRGQENAVSRRHLEQLTGLDGRTVRRRIEQERRSGTQICADNLTGYFLPATEHEKAACVRSMSHRAQEIMKTARAIERGGD